MRRREVIAGLLVPLLPRGACAQPAAMPAVGFLSSRLPQDAAVTALQQGMRETGYIEGRNVTVSYRWAEGRPGRLPGFAAEFVRDKVSIIISDGTAATLAAKAATATIPIVFSLGTDPLALGLVASLSRPGGNLTGVTSLSSQLAPKAMELLHELAPAATIFAVLVDPNSPSASEATTAELGAAARALGLELHVLNASSDSDFDAVFAAMARLRVGALLIAGTGTFNSRPEGLAALALHHAVPAVSWRREFAVAGGLASFGTDRPAAWRETGVYAGRILKGDKPADLPVQQTSKVDLVINLKTAKALGITVSQPLLARADEVIE